MDVRLQDLETRLAKGAPRAAWVHGDEPLLRIEAADAIRRRARVDGFTERSIIDINRYFERSTLNVHAGSMSLFAERRIIELRFADQAKPGIEAARVIDEFVSHSDPDTMVLVSGGRLDKRIREAMGAMDRVSWFVPVFSVSRQELPRWLQGRLARQRQQADDATLEFLADRVEGNLLAAHQEVSKLALLCPEGRLSLADVRDAVASVARYDPQDLVEAMLSGDVARSVRAIDGLRAEGEPMPRLVWFMADALRTLGRLHDAQAGGGSVAQTMREARVWAPRDRLFDAALRRTSRGAVARALADMAQIDRMAKGVGNGDPWRELLSVASRIATRRDTRATSAAIR